MLMYVQLSSATEHVSNEWTVTKYVHTVYLRQCVQKSLVQQTGHTCPQQTYNTSPQNM